jgi:hemerythrin
MAYYEWDSALETGYDLLDDQHKSLFALANALALAAERSFEEDDAVADAVYGLSAYVVEHFNDEEALMESFGYPGVGTHRIRHETFAAQVLEFSANYMTGRVVDPQRLAFLVTDWLTTHILQYDVEAVAYMKQASSARR